MSANDLFRAMGLEPIRAPEPIGEPVRQPYFHASQLSPYKAPASPDDMLARQAVAMIEREDGYFGCAEHRLNGAYDGDSEHRIALRAIQLMREQSNPREPGDSSRSGPELIHE